MASHGSAPELIHQRGSRAEYGQGLEVDHSNEGLQYRSGPETLPLTEKHAGYSGGYVNGDSTTSRSRTSRNPCDLSPLIFALLVATITAIIVGAAVGGGVGGALSNKSSSSSSTTAGTVTATTTRTVTAQSSVPTTNVQDYSALPPSEVQTLAWGCPNLQSYTTSTEDYNESFDVICGVDYGNDGAATQGGVVADIVGLVAYSPEECMTACVQMNYFQQRWGFGEQCRGITFGNRLSAGWQTWGGNCWLKNGTAVNPGASSDSLSASIAA